MSKTDPLRPTAAGSKEGTEALPTRPPSPPWRVLLVDDCADDAELTMIELCGAGIHADFARADSEASLLAALDRAIPHLVLSDLNMPGFDGARALAIVRERAPQARFVFLTGALREDARLPAVDGVLLKHDLLALPGLVRGLLGA